ncbi:MAG: MBL fold metallo-hydrolase [Paracoccaceae bacterium]
MTETPPPGVTVEVAPGVRRVTAPNPSPMTHTGTQSYLVGRPGGGGAVALIDPGPAIPDHLDALAAALRAGERVSAVLVTHSHLDHSALAPWAAERFGAPVLAFGPHGAGMSEPMRALAASGSALGGGEGADRGFAPDRTLAEGETVAAPDGGWRLTALHTPGHLSNHLSFLLDDRTRRAAFTGDAVMGWSTTLVSPPEGDMAAQRRTLARMADLAERLPGLILLPGHGEAVEDAAGLLARQIAHRDARRRAVLAALDDGPLDAAGVAARVYTDTPPALMGAATRNALATLLQLVDEGEAVALGPISAEVAFAQAGAGG